MIITCAECTTQFQLEEARVPESGIRVRCSVCKHAFFVPHPDALETDPVERVVGSVLADESGGVPPATRDLPGPDGDEGSWEFGDGGPAAPPGEDPENRFEQSFEAARDAVDELLGGEAPMPVAAEDPVGSFDEVGGADAAESLPGGEPLAWSASGAEPAQLDDPWERPAWADEEQRGPAVPAPAPQPQRRREDDAFPVESAADAFSIDGDADAEAPAPLQLELAGGDERPWWERETEQPADGRVPALPESDEPLLAAAQELEDHALGEALEAFETAGDEEDLPLEADASDAEARRDEPASEPARREPVAPAWDAAFAQDEAFPQPEAFAQHEAPPGAELAAAAPLPIAFDLPRRDRRRALALLAWFSRAGNGIGWGAVALLASAMLFGSVAPRRAPQLGGAQQVGGLEAAGLSGRWVENATLGPLYVVSGELRNPGAETRTAGARLLVRLLDAEGQLVEGAAASLAAPRGTGWLREADPDELRAVGERGAALLARTPLAPGARLPFEAVVVGMPDAAARFDLALAR